MITVKHRKTYTLELSIPSDDKLYAMFRETYDKRDSEPFLHTNEIFAFIESEVRPLVPFKKVKSYGFRLYTANPDKAIGMVVTFYLSDTDLDFIH